MVSLPVWALVVLATICFAPAVVIRRARWRKTAFNWGDYVLAGAAGHAITRAADFPASGDEIRVGWRGGTESVPLVRLPREPTRTAGQGRTHCRLLPVPAVLEADRTALRASDINLDPRSRRA